MSDREANLKEKIRQALASTVRVISDDLDIKKKPKKKNSNKFDFYELNNLNNKNDFIKARAETDSLALRKKFSNDKIYKNNLPNNSSCKSLYALAEKIRCETLGGKMLKGIKKNFNDNYNQIINLKRKDQLKIKEDVPVAEAFELYMLKNFHNIKLNSLTSKMLSFWEKDFDQSINKHIKFLKDNFEDQNIYNSRFSKILQDIEIFQTEDTQETKEENQEEGQEDQSNDNQESDHKDQKDENKNQETESSLDSDYEIDEYKLEEQLADADSDQQSSEQIIQKKNINDLNLEYKIYTTQFDEIIKAENLDDSDEINKLRKTLDQQLINFQDIVTKLANKLQRQLLAKQNRTWEFDLEDGLLDSSKLPRIIMDPYNSLSFKKEKDLDFKDTVVTLLIDNSGSMRGRPITIGKVEKVERLGLKVKNLKTQEDLTI